MNSLRLLGMCVVILSVIGCESGVITFPTPDPASVLIVNTTQNVPTVRVTMDSTINVDVTRGDASAYTQVAAGRPVTFFIGSPTTVYRDNLRYTLGGNGRVILFVRGDTTSLVEFRREIQDTVMPAGSTSSVIRFTHMAENVDKAYFLEFGSLAVPDSYRKNMISGSVLLSIMELNPARIRLKYVKVALPTFLPSCQTFRSLPDVLTCSIPTMRIPPR
ncbi:MAG: DUF4397 domain-containing protein [Ignavibacteria bacterium]|nr:DUF4397 domain-containing protein [Ignavibacteria bacterium]